MGTCGAFGFRLNEVDYITYNHCDSYPTGLGAGLVKELSNHPLIQNNNTDQALSQLRKVFEGIQLVASDSTPTSEQIEKYREFADTSVIAGELTDWYVLLRNAQGKLTPYLDGKVQVMIDDQEFLEDSLFCEWAYILNLDEGTLEIYKGLNQDAEAAGRYAKLSGFDEDYYGVRLIRTYPFSDILAGKVDMDSLEVQDDENNNK